MACLTTAVGIGTTVVSFIYEFLKKRVPYKLLMLIACIIGVFMGDHRSTEYRELCYTNFPGDLSGLHCYDHLGTAGPLSAERRFLQGWRFDGGDCEPGGRGA